jgi:hypothetical protein
MQNVISKTIMKDIQVINVYVQGSFGLLPEALDRLRGCHYFCNEVQRYSTIEDDQKAKWCFRAAMSAYQSVLDTIDSDIKNSLGKNFWKDSAQKKEMDNNTLVKLLSRVRNFAVHSARISGQIKKYAVSVTDSRGERVEIERSLFFDELKKSKNFKGVSGVTADEVRWFNKQSSTWPVNLLIRHGLYEASRYVHIFCVINRL